jgi:hypothetical protein
MTGPHPKPILWSVPAEFGRLCRADGQASSLAGKPSASRERPLIGNQFRALTEGFWPMLLKKSVVRKSFLAWLDDRTLWFR